MVVESPLTVVLEVFPRESLVDRVLNNLHCVALALTRIPCRVNAREDHPNIPIIPMMLFTGSSKASGNNILPPVTLPQTIVVVPQPACGGNQDMLKEGSATGRGIASTRAQHPVGNPVGRARQEGCRRSVVQIDQCRKGPQQLCVEVEQAEGTVSSDA